MADEIVLFQEIRATYVHTSQAQKQSVESFCHHVWGPCGDHSAIWWAGADFKNKTRSWSRQTRQKEVQINTDVSTPTFSSLQFKVINWNQWLSKLFHVIINQFWHMNSSKNAHNLTINHFLNFLNHRWPFLIWHKETSYSEKSSS